MPVDKEIREKIPVVSFLMMIVVMLYHCESPDNSLAVSLLDMRLSDAITYLICDVPCILCMSWFFAITGFLLFRKLSFRTLGTKLKTRVRTLLVPYLLWQLIFIVKALIQGDYLNPFELFGQIFLLRIWPPLGAFWYVYAVFVLAFLSPVLLVLFRNRRVGWISVLALIILLYVFWDDIKIGNGLAHYTGNIKMHFPAYLIGAYCGSVYDSKGKDAVLKALVGFLLSAALVNGLVSELLHNMAIAVLPMLILFALPVPEWSKNRSVYRCTFMIYATHTSLISLFMGRIRSVLYALVPSVTVSNLFGRIFCILLIIAVNYGICTLMRRFTPRTLSLLTGGRC